MVNLLRPDMVNLIGARSLEENKYYYGQNKDGTYGFLDANGALYSGTETFVGEVSKAIDQIRTGGSVGKSLVEDLMISTNGTEIVKRSSNAAGEKGDYITWNPLGTSSAPDIKGSTARPAFIGLAHEMAHVRDTWSGNKNSDVWRTVTDANGNTTTIPNAEIYATHVENQIRSENKLPLRAYYGVDGAGGGDPSTRLLRGNTQSLYYSPSGTTNYKQLGRKDAAFTY